MRAVLDTNVYVSAAIAPAGVSAEVVTRGIERRYELVVSPQLLTELEGVLRRPKFEQFITPDEVDNFLLDVKAGADLVDDPAEGPAITRDPKDDFVVALARTAEADFVVSGDLDLRDQQEPRPPVISPQDFLTRLDAT